MSTRSNIAIKRKDGSIESIYCHSNGDIEHNGYILYNYYNDIFKINKLLDLGDITLLGSKIDPNPNYKHGFDFDERQKNVVVSYGRDRNEKNVDKTVYKNLKDYQQRFEDSMEEYAYLFDEDKNEWLCASVLYKTDLEFEPLDQALLDWLIEYSEVGIGI